MRELKFRVWNIEDKVWDNTSILEVWSNEGKLEPFQYIKSGKLNPVYIPTENYIIQQFTGFLDKNKKEVYEGDIVKYICWSNECEKTEYESISDVGFSDGSFYPRYMENNCEDVWYSYGISSIEIIGNIFENPELLKK